MSRSRKDNTMVAAMGVLVVVALLGDRFAAPPVQFAATMPGDAGSARAFAAFNS